MANFIDCLGLGDMANSEEDLKALVATVVERGTPIVGYYGDQYINYHIGDAQLVVRTHINPEDQKVEVTGFDTHADGNSIWTVRLHEMDADLDEDRLSKRVAVTKEDGSGLALINLVNADVIPSFARDEILELQMIAFPYEIKYFRTEQEYDEFIQDDMTGGNFGPGEGSVIPAGLFAHQFVTEGEDTGEEMPRQEDDDITLVRGVVKKLYKGILNNGEEDYAAYIRCIVDTEFGELEIDHAFSAVSRQDANKVKVGSIVVASVVLSGLALDGDTEMEFARNEDNALKLLRYTFIKGDPERLRLMLADDAEYQLDSNGQTYVGKNAIIERIKYIQENGAHKYYAHMATITGIDGDCAEDDYPIDTRCIILTGEDEDDYESIAFVTLNDEGYISKIYTCMDSKYRFHIERLETPDLGFEEDEWEEIDRFEHRMILRASLMGFHSEDPDIVEEEIKISDYTFNELQTVFLCRPEDKDLHDEETAKDMLGYMFSKGIEAYAFNELHAVVSHGFSIKGLNGEIDPIWINDQVKLKYNLEEKLQYAFEKGKSFYTDAAPMLKLIESDEYMNQFFYVMAYVYSLGKYCANEYLSYPKEKRNKRLYRAYKDILWEYFDLDETPIGGIINEIYEPDVFTKKVYEYCKEKYSYDEKKKNGEFTITSYYGAMCAAIMWKQGNRDFNGLTAWDYMEEVMDVEFTDVKAEELLGIRDNETRIDIVWQPCQEYLHYIRPVVDACNHEGEDMYEAMRYAYMLGMISAHRWLLGHYGDEEKQMSFLIETNQNKTWSLLNNPDDTFSFMNNHTLELLKDSDGNRVSIENYDEAIKILKGLE